MAAIVHTATFRRLGSAALVCSMLTLIGGCACNTEKTPGGEPVVPTSAADQKVVYEGPIEPAQVELSDPKARIEKGIFQFEVKYRFTKGKPRQHYLLTVTFPGATKNLCLKTMEAFELKTEGSIKDAYELFEQPVTAYEMVFSETSSPQSPYKKISNTATGTVP